jgi:type II secretory pathway component GspD/PulD (secretin)
VQKAETQVRLNNGQTLVIGGLVKRKTVITNNKVPILGDIPVVGMLFTSKRENTDPHQDLLIFLTVRLIEEPAITRQALAP